MKSFEHYKAVAKEALDEAVSGPESQGSEELWGKIWNGNKFEQLVSALRLVKGALPGSLSQSLRRKFEDNFYNSGDLPFDPKKYEFKGKIGQGGQSRVFLLESLAAEDPSLVLKVLRYTSRDGREPLDQIKEMREEYREFRELYASLPDLIPEEYFTVIGDPYHPGQAAGAMLQPFLGLDIRDVFDIEPEELRRMAGENPHLAEQIAGFSKITFGHEAETGEVMDLLGPKNLSVIRAPEGDRLVLLDPHVMISTREDEAEPVHDRQARVQARLGTLKHLFGSLA